MLSSPSKSSFSPLSSSSTISIKLTTAVTSLNLPNSFLSAELLLLLTALVVSNISALFSVILCVSSSTSSSATNVSFISLSIYTISLFISSSISISLILCLSISDSTMVQSLSLFKPSSQIAVISLISSSKSSTFEVSYTELRSDSCFSVLIPSNFRIDFLALSLSFSLVWIMGVLQHVLLLSLWTYFDRIEGVSSVHTCILSLCLSSCCAFIGDRILFAYWGSNNDRPLFLFFNTNSELSSCLFTSDSPCITVTSLLSFDELSTKVLYISLLCTFSVYICSDSLDISLAGSTIVISSSTVSLSYFACFILQSITFFVSKIQLRFLALCVVSHKELSETFLVSSLVLPSVVLEASCTLLFAYWGSNNDRPLFLFFNTNSELSSCLFTSDSPCITVTSLLSFDELSTKVLYISLLCTFSVYICSDSLDISLAGSTIVISSSTVSLSYFACFILQSITFFVSKIQLRFLAPCVVSHEELSETFLVSSLMLSSVVLEASCTVL